MEFLISAVYIYIAIFSLYFLVLSIRNLNSDKLKIDEVSAYNIPKKQLCVVIYTHNQLKSLERIVEQLRRQDYAINNFQTYVILDNCTDGSRDFLSLKTSVNVLDLSEGGYIGKNAAISILLEKLIPNDNIDAYVFLDVDKYINVDLLTNVNYALTKNDVITGAIVYQNHEVSFVNQIKRVYSKYLNNFLFSARSLFGLSNIIDSDFLVLSKNLVDKIGGVDFSNVKNEMKFSLLLSHLKNVCCFNPNLKCYSTTSNITLKKASLIDRLKLFKNAVTSTKTFNLSYVEFVYSLINPNCLFLIFAFISIAIFSYNYFLFASVEIILVTFLLLFLGLCLSLIKADLCGKEYLYLILYPIYSLGQVILSFPLFSFIVKLINKNNSKVQKYVVDVVATTASKKRLFCKLELISRDDMSWVCLKYKNKKFTTSKHLRMRDALKELIDKLRDYNLTLNICQCCKYFAYSSDGSLNMINGYCKYKFAGISPSDKLNVLLWNVCQAFEPNSTQSIIEELANG